MNHVTVAGHLGADPEVRFTSGGQKVTSMRVAARSRKSGKDETIWWRVTLWGEQFDKIMTYFKKGSSAVVIGEMSPPEMYTDRNGNTQISMNLTAFHLGFSPFGKSDSSQGGGGNQQYQQQQAKATAYAAPEPQVNQMAGGMAPPPQNEMPAFSDDEIPF